MWGRGACDDLMDRVQSPQEIREPAKPQRRFPWLEPRKTTNEGPRA